MFNFRSLWMPSRVFHSNSGLIHLDSLACWTAANVIQDLRKLAGCDVNLPLLRCAQFACVSARACVRWWSSSLRCSQRTVNGILRLRTFAAASRANCNISKVTFWHIFNGDLEITAFISHLRFEVTLMIDKYGYNTRNRLGRYRRAPACPVWR